MNHLFRPDRFRSCAALLLALIAMESQNANAAVVKIEAESGVLGVSWTNGTDGATQFISVNSTASGSAPTNASRVATYIVTFPSPGTYDLYARVRVGPG